MAMYFGASAPSFSTTDHQFAATGNFTCLLLIPLNVHTLRMV